MVDIAHQDLRIYQQDRTHMQFFQNSLLFHIRISNMKLNLLNLNTLPVHIFDIFHYLMNKNQVYRVCKYFDLKLLLFLLRMLNIDRTLLVHIDLLDKLDIAHHSLKIDLQDMDHSLFPLHLLAFHNHMLNMMLHQL